MKTSPGRKVRATRPAAARNGPQRMPELFPIVGIGASAGGLEAFAELLHNLPEKTGMAFVLVQHLDPKHESALPEILGRTTKLPVNEVTDGTVVQPNHVYVIPANTSMMIDEGALQLRARTTVRGQHMPIDNFFVRWRKRLDSGRSGWCCRAQLPMAPRDVAPSRMRAG
ncbi:MAG: chemotaxis protein CheB [Candidatus Sulfotelmatobacter sp.]